jgi:hypothetical protein
MHSLRSMSGVGVFLRARGWRPVVVAAYAIVLAAFFYTFAQFYIPGKGFTYLVAFGGRSEMSRLPVMGELAHYVQSDSDGYDAQYYAQIAMDPLLRDPKLKQAVDSVPYRARRILFSWTAYSFGFGRPAAILTVFTLQNALCWLALAAVLLRWFPPASWTDFLRWAGVLFSFGMCVSLRYSLVDGPSLLLIAAGVWAVEANRRWLAAGIFALSGLGKETNLLGAASLAPKALRDGPRWRATVLQWVLVVAPLALWLLYIQRHVGPASDLGARNFDLPAMAYLRKLQVVLRELVQPEIWAPSGNASQAIGSLAMMVALTVQFLFLALRPRGQSAWWRVGASFAVLMLVLGDAVWEGYPGAASRVLLPMQLAFNVLVPRSRAWLAVLVLGNLTIISVRPVLEPPVGEGYAITGPAALVKNSEGAHAQVIFDAAWYDTETDRRHFWHWSRDDADILITNPRPQPARARLTFSLGSVDERQVQVRTAERALLWSGTVPDGAIGVELPSVVLLPGPNRLRFTSDRPPARAGNGDSRLFAFSLRDLHVEFVAAEASR